MAITSLRDGISGNGSPKEIADWLRGEFLVELKKRFNTSDVRRRLALYHGERVPDNERNLTDVRNRVSMIVEYELARLANEILRDGQVDDFFWSYVVANRFPDLEVRGHDGRKTLRIEVKCLQSIAEEKAANFDTLKKDLNPVTDYVVVFLWEWCKVWDTIQWDRAPKILDFYVFNASALAAMRDAYWLNRPPNNLGGGYQGFDLRYAVNCTSGIFNEEEGNYGKLLRFWSSDFQFPPPQTPEIIDANAEYTRFKDGVVIAGFKTLCELLLPGIAESDEPLDLLTDTNGELRAAVLGQYAFCLASKFSAPQISDLIRRRNLKFCISMTDKYASTIHSRAGKINGPMKPKAVANAITNLA